MRAAIAVPCAALLLAVPALVLSQQPEDLPRKSDIAIQVEYVIAPTTVLDKDGRFVNGLNLANFALYDNDKPQRIVQDVVAQPISLVVAVQASSDMEGMLSK